MKIWPRILDHFLLPCSVYWIIRTDLTQLKRLKLNFYVGPFFETIDFAAFLPIVRNLPRPAGLHVIKRFSWQYGFWLSAGNTAGSIESPTILNIQWKRTEDWQRKLSLHLMQYFTKKIVSIKIIFKSFSFQIEFEVRSPRGHGAMNEAFTSWWPGFDSRLWQIALYIWFTSLSDIRWWD